MLSAKRGVLMVGAGAPDAQAIHELATRLGWPVLADPRSGARISAATTIASADLLMRHDHFVNRATPDVIVQFGRPWASKVLSRWVSECGATRLVVDPFGEWIDEQRSADIFINSSPNDLIQALQRQSLTAASPDWLATWSSAEDAAQKVIHDLFDDEASLSEPGIARTLARSVASGSSVVLSSSMPVRDVEWFASPRQGVDYYSNRGANGIDGVVATAVGVAAISSGRTFALLGDLAFLHDSNGLLAAKSADTGPITLVVVDNAGGGIFSFLPQASNLDTAEFELLFGTPQEADIEAVARAFGAEVATVSSADQLLKSLQQPMSNLDVVVVRTDRVTNVVKHAEAVERVGQALNNL
jgi:2-succinyl-5-enolpyruvyl-6-hydroxy-3-cyclohexene-1-carboxylate synthase